MAPEIPPSSRAALRCSCAPGCRAGRWGPWAGEKGLDFWEEIWEFYGDYMMISWNLMGFNGDLMDFSGI